MAKEDKKQLDPVLTLLRKLITEKDFMELALLYIQREKRYVIYGIDKGSIKNGLCIKCYDIQNTAANGLVTITTEKEIPSIREWIASHTEYQWYYRLTYNSIDKLLIWIQRNGNELPYKYRKLTDKVQKALGCIREREYGWWEKEEDMAK